MDYIYIDESGELAKQTKYFVIGAILVKNPNTLDRLVKKARIIHMKKIGKSKELKGNRTPKSVLKKLLKKLNKLDYEAVVVVLDKKNKYKIVNNHDYNILYDTIASELAKELKITNPTNIIIDKCKPKEKYVDNFNNMFLPNLDNVNCYTVDIKHEDSVNHKGLQIIDIIVWSVFQSVEHGDSSFIDLLDNVVIKRAYED
ncbi:DUF3800 domain-containing protein [Methanobrevibacter sp.]|uniref:DUF3800 domain-containing protein n=1 Tax=Methanobrevibacter sp. TaxID=66852 RepID=UPI00388F0E38